MAVVLLLQSGAAMAHCLRGMSHGEAIEICSIDGVRTIHLDQDGNPLADEAPQMQGGFCPACHALPAVELPGPPIVAAPAWHLASPNWHAAGEARLLPPARAPPYATRAPPAFAI